MQDSDDTEGRRPQDQEAPIRKPQPQQQNAQRGREGDSGDDGRGGGLRHEGGASQDFAGQGGDKGDAAQQTDHNLRGGGVGSRPTSP